MRPTQKLVQYLNEAHAHEHALTRVLQEQIAMTPRGTYRNAIEAHLSETRDHARRLERRLGDLDAGSNPIQVVVGLAESVVGQALALAKTPLDIVRGTGGEEKVLKNARDTAATEALEIATYTSIERAARDIGDDRTAELAASIRRDEERMLERVLREIPKLTDEVLGDGGYDFASTGAAETARRATSGAAETARRATSGAADTVRRTVNPPPRIDDLGIDRYDELSSEEIVGRLPTLTQAQLAAIDAYERGHDNRMTILDRVRTLRGDEPWPGYDELSAAEVRRALAGADSDRIEAVRVYERAHKDRTSVLNSA